MKEHYLNTVTAFLETCFKEDQDEEVQWFWSWIMFPLHYWLRWSIGFWNVQKVDKSRQLFLIQKTHQVIFAACFELVMTHILRRKKIWWRWYGIIGQNYGKCSKKVEDGLIRGWFFVWWKYRPYREKKLKIATLNEAVFMVKIKFKNQNMGIFDIFSILLKDFRQNLIN